VRILVLGGDGYLGWPSALHLSAAGHEVGIADNFVRREYDTEMGVSSLVPIRTLDDRVNLWEKQTGERIATYVGDLCDADFTYRMVADFAPDTIVHFASMPSTPRPTTWSAT
jgi:UDP-sulfoquinovose synthase